MFQSDSQECTYLKGDNFLSKHCPHTHGKENTAKRGCYYRILAQNTPGIRRKINN